MNLNHLHRALKSSMLTKNINLKTISTFKLNKNVTNSAGKLKSNIILEKSVQSYFRFTDYDCIGFDLDNTICRYKVGAMMKMEYEALSRYMVKEKGYPSTHLFKPLEEHEDFILKGLILDLNHGNLLRIAPDGKIIHASHGTRHLSQSQLKEIYGESCHWAVTDQFCKDPLITWNGPMSEQMRTVLDYFDMPAGLVFARTVDTLDEITGGPVLNYNIWPDVLSGLVDMFDRTQFRLNKGDYFPKIKANPELYINKCNEELINWLKDLKARNKKLFLITGSHVDFASFTARFAMGINWNELFDIVVFFAKKPGFFNSDRPFLSINGNQEGSEVSLKDLKSGEFYSQGNWTEFKMLLSKSTGMINPRVAYVGDNIIQDVFTPAYYTECDSVAIVEELQAEGIYGFDRCHNDHKTLVSEMWGSFFSHNKKDATDSIWGDMIRNYSKLSMPSMEYIASYPVDYKFKSF